MCPICAFQSAFCSLQMLVKCIFGHKNALCQPVSPTISLECQGGWAAFQCRTLMAAYLGALPFHAKACTVCHSVLRLASVLQLASARRMTQIPTYSGLLYFIPFIYLFTIFYPIHISSFLRHNCPLLLGHNYPGHNYPPNGGSYPPPFFF